MENLSTWADVKAELDERPRGTAYKLARTLEMNSSYFYRKLKSASDLTERQARTVRNFLAHSELSDEGPGARRDEEPRSIGPARRTRVPLYGYAAGSDGELISLAESQLLDWVDLPSGVTLGEGDYFAVQLIGSSMEPRIFAGDKVVVRRNYPPGREKDVLVEFTDGTGLLKTYTGRREGRIFLRQYNEPKVIDVDATKVKALHAVYFPL